MSDDGNIVASVQSFVRGLAVIRAFDGAGAGMTLTEIAARADLSRAGARRLLYTLCNEGYARTDGKHFWLTPRVLDLGYSYLSSMPLWGFAQQYLDDLRRTLRESASLSVLDGDDVVYIMRAQTDRILTSHLGVGSRLPAHVVSMGRVLLAGLSDDALNAYLTRAGLEAFTPHTVTDPEELRAALMIVRQQGHALVDRELDIGISGIAVPVRDRAGLTIAAINVNFHPDRARDQAAQATILEHLRRVQQQVEALIAARA